MFAYTTWGVHNELFQLFDNDLWEVISQRQQLVNSRGCPVLNGCTASICLSPYICVSRKATHNSDDDECFYSTLGTFFFLLLKGDVTGLCLWKIKYWNAGRESLPEAFSRQTVNDKQQTVLYLSVFSLPHQSVLPVTSLSASNLSWPGHTSSPDILHQLCYTETAVRSIWVSNSLIHTSCTRETNITELWLSTNLHVKSLRHWN